MHPFCFVFNHDVPCIEPHCSQKYQAHLLPYLTAPSPHRPSGEPVQCEEWLFLSRLVLQFILDPSQHVEALAGHARAREHAAMLMKCSLRQLTPQVWLGIVVLSSSLLQISSCL